ncbi:hypothetical protein B0A49_11604 [Cryomyces minteri]|uniref:HAT C-terminal dimerisation domain-containing protein n=1 Tax=Cryomyces minteri TaxID=331657 RepID=A0A4U0WGX6_9PEZI|nr:hypothetical protein B0A49_11604 [Cryomyces minteri]
MSSQDETESTSDLSELLSEHFSGNASDTDDKEFQAINAQWVSPEGKLYKALLAFPELHFGHGGAEVAPYFMETLKHYEIERKLGYITSDNHGANDKLLRVISSELAKQDPPIEWDPVQHRCRCFGHVVNLATQAFMFAEDSQAISIAELRVANSQSETIDEALTEPVTQDKKQGWHATEPVQKLYNFMIACRNMVYHNEFKTLSGGRSILFNKYWELLDETAVYVAALLLHPSQRLAYLKKTWTGQGSRGWLTAGVKRAKELWLQQYKEQYTAQQAEPAIPSASAQPTAWERYKKKIDITPIEDDFTSFVNAPPTKLAQGSTPISWWCQPDQQAAYPALSKMAVDCLSALPMSAESERSFSGSRRTISWERARLGGVIVEQTQCCKSWERTGLAHGSSGHNNDDIMVIEALETTSPIPETPPYCEANIKKPSQPPLELEDSESIIPLDPEDMIVAETKIIDQTSACTPGMSPVPSALPVLTEEERRIEEDEHRESNERNKWIDIPEVTAAAHLSRRGSVAPGGEHVQDNAGWTMIDTPILHVQRATNFWGNWIDAIGNKLPLWQGFE